MNTVNKIKAKLISRKKIISFYMKLARFLANGVPLLKALDIIYAHETNDEKKQTVMSKIISDVRLSLKSGKSFAGAMAKWVNANDITQITAGEVSGKLGKALEDLVYLDDASGKIKSALWGLAYPFALILVTCFYMYIFGARVVPAFSDIVPVEKWSASGKRMASFADFVMNDLWIVFCCIFFLMLLSVFSLPRLTGSIRKILDIFPPWSFYKLNTASGFMMSLAALLNAGVPVPEALSLLSAHASPWYKKHLISIRKEMLSGARNIGEAMLRAGHDFPDKEMITDLRSYAELDGFETLLEKLASQWLERVVSLVKVQIAIIKNVVLVIMGIIFMFIVSGMFELQNIISSNAGA